MLRHIRKCLRYSEVRDRKISSQGELFGAHNLLSTGYGPRRAHLNVIAMLTDFVVMRDGAGSVVMY